MANMNRNKIVLVVALLAVVLGGWMLLGKDRAEEAPTVEYSESIIGAWRNVEYKGLVREFKEGGVLTDSVGNDVIEGTWQMFDGTSAPEMVGMNFDEELVYLKINLTGEELGDIYFEVTSLDSTDLELRSLDRVGGTLSFTREN